MLKFTYVTVRMSSCSVVMLGHGQLLRFLLHDGHNGIRGNWVNAASRFRFICLSRCIVFSHFSDPLNMLSHVDVCSMLCCRVCG